MRMGAPNVFIQLLQRLHWHFNTHPANYQKWLVVISCIFNDNTVSWWIWISNILWMYAYIASWMVQWFVVQYLKGHCHWSVVDQFHHHGCLTASAIKPTNILVLCGINASAAWVNVTWRVFPSIWKAWLVHNAKILNVLSDQVREPTITALKRERKLLRKHFKMWTSQEFLTPKENWIICLSLVWKDDQRRMVKHACLLLIARLHFSMHFWIFNLYIHTSYMDIRYSVNTIHIYVCTCVYEVVLHVCLWSLEDQKSKVLWDLEHHQKHNHVSLVPLSTFSENSLKSFWVILLQGRSTDAWLDR